VAYEIGEIYVKISGKIDEFQKSMDQVRKQLDATEKRFEGLEKTAKKLGDIGKKLTLKLTVPLTTLASSITFLAVKTGQWADRILDLTQITGLSSKTIQEFQHVARIAGVNIETVTYALESLIRRIPMLETGFARYERQLAKIGLTYEDLRKLSPEDLFAELLTRLAGMTDIMQRNAIASTLFGDAWKGIAPILGLGRERIEKIRKEAHELGFVLEETALKKALDFRIAFDKLKASIDFAGKRIAIAFMPLIERVMKVIERAIAPITKLGEAFGELPKPVQDIIFSLGVFAASIGPVILGIKALISAIVGLKTALAFLSGSLGIISLALSALAALGTYVALNWERMEKVFIKFGTTLVKYVTIPIVKTVKHIVNLFSWIPGVEKAVDSLSSTLEELNTEVRELEAKALAKSQEAMESTAGSTQNLTQSLEELQNQFSELTDTMADNIQSFDEVHQLQEETGEVTETGFIIDTKSLADATAKLQGFNKELEVSVENIDMTNIGLEDIEKSFMATSKAVDTAAGSFSLADGEISYLSDSIYEVSLNLEGLTTTWDTLTGELDFQPVFDLSLSFDTFSQSLNQTSTSLVTLQADLETTTEAVVTSLDVTESQVSTTFDSVQSSIETTMEATQTTVANSLTNVQTSFETSMGSVNNTVTTSMAQMEGAIDLGIKGMTTTFEKGMANIESQVDESGKVITTNLDTTMDTSTDIVSQGLESITYEFDLGLTGLMTEFDSSMKSIESTTGVTAEDITSTFENMFEETTTVTESSFEDITSITEEGTDTILEEFEDLSDELVGHSVIPELRDRVKDIFEETFSDTLNRTEQWKDNTLNVFETFSKGVKESIEKIKPVLEDFGVDVEDFTRDVEIATKIASEDIAETIEEFIKGNISAKEALENITDSLLRILDRAFVSALAPIIRQSLAQIGTWLVGILAKIGTAIGSFLSEAYAALVSFFWWMGPGAPAAAAGVIAGAVAMLGVIADQAIRAFRNLVGLEEGGIVTEPTLAILGEGGKKEAVIPLERNNVIADSVGEAVFEAMTLALQAQRAIGSPSQEEEITIEIDGRELARALIPYLQSEIRRTGASLVEA